MIKALMNKLNNKLDDSVITITPTERERVEVGDVFETYAFTCEITSEERVMGLRNLVFNITDCSGVITQGTEFEKDFHEKVLGK